MNDVESVIEPLLNSSTSTTDVIFYSILIVGGIGVICHFVFRLRRVVEFIPSGSVGNFVSRTIITGGQSSKVAHFLYGFSAGFGVCGGGGGGAHA